MYICNYARHFYYIKRLPLARATHYICHYAIQFSIYFHVFSRLRRKMYGSIRILSSY